MRAWIGLAFLVFFFGCDDEPAPVERARALPERELIAGGLSWSADAPFVRRRADNEIRSAEYGVRGYEEATLGVFHFPPSEGGGGSVDENVDRWVGQFTQPSGRASREVARVEPREVGDLRVTVVDIEGTFVGRMGMGGPTEPREHWRLLGAIAEGPEGLVFFKLIGPDDAVAAAQDAFDALVESIHRI
jgi:hypothetical protein